MNPSRKPHQDDSAWDKVDGRYALGGLVLAALCAAFMIWAVTVFAGLVR